MKRAVCQLSLIIAALAAAPAALAGAEIVKCVARDGHVTITDQPCSDGAATMVLETDAPADAQPAVEHVKASRALPPRRDARRAAPAPATTPARLSRDVATVKAARMQLLLIDARAQRPTQLAGLD